MANEELPGSVPGQFPETPGETFGTDEHEYIRNTGPFKGGTSEEEPGYSVGRPEASLPTEGEGTTLWRGDEEKTDYGRDAAIAGGAAGATGAAGYGAYELSKNDDSVNDSQPTPTQPVVQEEETHYGRDAAIAGGATGAAGVGAYELNKDDKDYRPYERAGQGAPATEGELENKFATYNLNNDPNPERTEEMKEKQLRAEALKSSGGEHGPVEEVAAAGGATAAVGAGTAAAVSSDRDISSADDTDTAPGAYERAGKGALASDDELQNKFDTYLPFNDPNPGRTEAMKEQIRKTEEIKAKLVEEGVVDPPSEKKGGIFSKLRRSSKDQSKEMSEASTTPAASTVTDEELRRSSSGPAADPHPEHLVIHKEGSHPDAPTLIVREHPDGY